MNNFEIKIESKKKGFSKEQLKDLYREIHGPGANIKVEEVLD